MVVVAAYAQEVCHGNLCKCSSGNGMHEFQLLNPLHKSARHAPANTITRSKRFRNRAAMQNPSFSVKTFACFRTVPAEIKFTINIILNQWYLVARNKLYQFLLVFIWHTATQWIIKIGNENAGLDVEFFNSSFQY